MTRDGAVLESSTPMSGQSVVVLGQDQDEVGGEFQESQSFSGNISEVGFWPEVLGDQEILEMSNCDTDMPASPLLEAGGGWSVSPEVVVSETPRESLCQGENLLLDLVFITESVSTDDLVLECGKINGQLPSPTSAEEANAIDVRAKEAAKHLWLRPQDSFYSFPLALKRNGSEWHNIHTNAKLQNRGFFNDYNWDGNCLRMFKSQVNVFECDRRVDGGLCLLPPAHYLTLKGLCHGDLWDSALYDSKFYFHGVKNGKPALRY